MATLNKGDNDVIIIIIMFKITAAQKGIKL